MKKLILIIGIFATACSSPAEPLSREEQCVRRLQRELGISRQAAFDTLTTRMGPFTTPYIVLESCLNPVRVENR